LEEFGEEDEEEDVEEEVVVVFDVGDEVVGEDVNEERE
jgi:hypothetical protein